MISGWAGRHRRPLLLAGVAVLVAYAAAAYRELPAPGWPPAILVAIALLVLAVLDHRRPRPTALVVGHGEFAAPPSASAVCVALAMLLVAAGGLGTFVRQARIDGRWLPGLAVAAVWLAVTGVVVVSAWRGGDVRLRPDGIRTGRRLLPWEALDPSYPAVRGRGSDQLALGLAAGGTRILRTDDVDARFLAGAIRFYAHRPAHRAAIGTAAGYGRLIGSLDGDARLPDVPANRDLVEFLRHQATPGKADRWDLDGWEMHVHPDLQERMRELAGAVVPVLRPPRGGGRRGRRGRRARHRHRAPPAARAPAGRHAGPAGPAAERPRLVRRRRLVHRTRPPGGGAARGAGVRRRPG